MVLAVSLTVAVLFGTGTYLTLRTGSFEVILGLSLLTYGVNTLLFASGGGVLGSAPVIGSPAPMPDPIPQALVLTAIVISFAMTAFVLVLALKAWYALDTDHVDGVGP